MNPLHSFRDIHAHLAPGSTDAPEGVLVSLTPVEARRVLTRPELKGSFSFGIHPWDTEEAVDWEEFERFVAHPAVVAVGECGLDRLRGAAPEVQEQIFRHQIRLAEKYGKPMILHIVKAVDEMLRIRREERPAMPWILHGFRGNPQQARQLLGAGLSLSLGERFNPAVPAVIPPERLFRESDRPV